jgi:glycerophosphoryl diester phosphodiesterase
MRYCECDVSLTLDEHIVLCHDSNFKRLALFDSNNSLRPVSELTFRELIALPLKSGQRPPLLTDVLSSAANIGSDAQLVIEIKPGNAEMPRALCGLFYNEPALLQNIGVIMSFDLWVIHRFAAEFQLLENNLKAEGRYSPRKFKILLLTISDEPEGPPYLRLNIENDTLMTILDDWLTASESSLDGVYLQYEKNMLAEHHAVLEQLTSKMVVGVWGYAKKDPDTLEHAANLLAAGVHFINTDMPRTFCK